MRRMIPIALLVAALVALPARGLAVEPGVLTNGTELASTKSGLDGAAIVLEGEVISETLRGGPGHVWLNVLSGGTAIGVWAPTELTEDLAVFGDWGHEGDRISVTGVFNEACDVHGGDLDVHATSISLIAAGTSRSHPIEYWKLAVGAAGVALAYSLYRRSRFTQQEDHR